MPLYPPPNPSTRQMLRDQFVGQVLAITGDTRWFWLPRPTDTTTSTDESLNARVLTHSATLAGRLAGVGLGSAVSFNGTTHYTDTPDTADLSYGNGTNDSACSFVAVCNVTNSALTRVIASKWNDGGNSEYLFSITTGDQLRLALFDQSAGAAPLRTSGAITQGSTVMFAATYGGAGGATAADGITLYENGLVISSAATNAGAYVAMENTATVLEIGSNNVHTAAFFSGSQGLNLSCQKALSASEVWSVWKLVKGYFAL